MADSGTYSPETIARRQKIADTLLMQAVKPREIRNPIQGLGQLGEAGLAGWEGYRSDQEEKQSRAEAVAQALQAFGGGSGQPPVGPAAAPMAAPQGMPPTPVQSASLPAPAPTSDFMPNVGSLPPGPAPAAIDASMPRGMRNNNPLNIEAGGFTQGQPGFSGSDGRFAKFDTPQAGIGAASKLLDSYAKRGLTTPAGIVGRWAPGSDGNNVPAYAQAIAAKLGIGPNDQIPPEMRPQLIAAMGQHENGRPIGDVAAALQAGGGVPPAAGGPAPAQAAQNAPAAAAGPQGAAPNNREGIIKALMNPWVPDSVRAALLSQVAGKPELKEAGTDPITGQKSYQEYDPVSHTMRPVGGAPGTAQAQAQPGMLAQGVSQIDHTLTGDTYLKQFGPEIQSAVKSYMNGDVIPTGNPRMAGIANAAKVIAQKYGQDTGQPVSDSLYAEKRKYRTELGSNMPSTAGGQAKAFNQGIEHMGALAGTLEKLDNSSGLGIPIVADAVNAVRQGTSTEQSAVADKARSIGQTLAGEVGKLFSGSAGGGVEERRMTRDRFDTVKSPAQLAAALEATLETMRGGLTALEGRRDQVLGPNNDVKFVTGDTEKKIAQIEATISRLKGEKQAPAADAAAAAAGGLPPGWTVKVH